MRLKLGNPKVDNAAGIKSIEIPDQMKTNIKTGISHLDMLFCGDGVTPSTVCLLTGVGGAGKCFKIDTPILMYDGLVKPVQNVKVNDLVMGPDSKPRKVLNLARGQEMIYEIKPKKGDSWFCNESHTLTLKSNRGNQEWKTKNISVKDYLSISNQRTRKDWVQYRSTVIEFKNSKKVLDFDPYLIGFWIGDGTKEHPNFTCGDSEPIKYLKNWANIHNYFFREVPYKKAKCKKITLTTKRGQENPFLTFLKTKCEENNIKRIPTEYKTSSVNNRLAFLAGLLDSDGYYGNGCFEITTKEESLKDDYLFIIRSLGLAGYAHKTYKRATNSPTHEKTLYWRISISGNLNKIPTLIKRKQATQRKQIKNVLHTQIEVLPTKIDDYYGFAVDKDNLFLLGDFTVVHNSTLGIQLADAASNKGHVVLYNTGEEAFYQVRKSYNRLGLTSDFLIGDHQDVDELLARGKSIQADFPNQQMFLVLDSLQILTVTPEPGHKGRPMAKDSQIVEGVQRLYDWAKETFAVVILIGQVTKDGEFAGRQQLKHIVDTHLHLSIDTDRRGDTYGQRIAEMLKNRFGPAGVYYPFELGQLGLTFNLPTRGL